MKFKGKLDFACEIQGETPVQLRSKVGIQARVDVVGRRYSPKRMEGSYAEVVGWVRKILDPQCSAEERAVCHQVSV